jgi:O-antigen ligase
LTFASGAVARPTGLPTRTIADGLLWLVIFLGGFVLFEPAPYELFLALLIPLWMLIGFSVPRAVGPLIVLMLLFIAGGILAATQAKDFSTQPIYYAVTAFLAFSSCFFACLIGEDSDRLDTIVGAWIWAALVTVSLGVIGYAGLTGGLFTKFDRATGAFQDPNVFGPFLIFPFAVLLRRALTRPFGEAVRSALLALVIFIGIFLSFSRAAWALTVVTTLLIGVLLIATKRSAKARARVLILGAAGVLLMAIVVAAALSVPAISDLFADRAQFEQSYDAGHLGRFQRHAIGFNLMLDHPLGIGAIEFGRTFGEDEHDIWLKALTTYGWLGFAAFVSLVIWTLIAAFPLLFRTGRLQAVTQIAYIVFFGHILMATVIDIDHWRHVFLLFGILWGAIAADRVARRITLTRLIGHLPAIPP